jgi:protocatechuate 3,4-dioxygenase beta subunit
MNRRQALAGMGTLSLGAVLAACGDSGGTGSATSSDPGPAGATRDELFAEAPSCSLTPEQTEGPFYFDADAVRSDVREDREGTALRLAIRVRGAGSCEPIADAVVDVWHADAEGAYSGFDVPDERFLRGTQVTDGEGIVEFTTIYPGWYPGRTPHIHARVHLDRTSLLTTQLYFDEAVSEAVFAGDAYARDEAQDVGNADDGIFDQRLALALSRQDEGWLGAISFDVEEA